MRKIAACLYAVVAYLIFLATLLYAIGFVGNVFVPKSIDSGAGAFSAAALAIDACLLALFAVQHSVMARQWFKRRWTKLIPPPIERSTYVLLASLCLLLLYWQWRPMTEAIWDARSQAGRDILQGLFWIGWLMVLGGTFLVDHFDLFGLRQVWLYLRGVPYTPIGFKTPLLYKCVRHPIYFCTLIGLWAAPRMTLGHLLLSVATTGYFLLGIQFEERDLITSFGDAYRHYRAHTPMLVPFLKWRK
jgi:methanethiol S-methyltransferase